MGSAEKTELEKNEFSRERERRHNICVIFRYADWVDILLMLLGTIGAIGDGMSTNWLILFVSRIMNSLGYGSNSQQNNNNFMGEVEKVSSLLDPVLNNLLLLFLSVLIVLSYLSPWLYFNNSAPYSLPTWD